MFNTILFYACHIRQIRDWSLITGRGGLQNGRGGHVKFYPSKRGGGGKSFSRAEGGGTKSFGVVFMR